MERFVFGLIAAFAASTISGQAATTMPKEYHGEWREATERSAPACGRKDDDSKFVVSARRIDIHEGICTPLRVTREGAGHRIRLSCEQEDGRGIKTEHWQVITVNGRKLLKTRGRYAGQPYSATHGLCAAPASASAASEPSPARGRSCYRKGHSEFSLTPRADGTADFSLLSAQGNAHICGIEGRAKAHGEDYRYDERLESGGVCRLTIWTGGDGFIRFSDEEQRCKQHHCGARASFENIEFGSRDRVSCPR